MTRLQELQEIFSNVDENRAKVVMPLLPQLVFIEERLEELQKMPLLRVHPKDPARQEITPAGKQYKELMQTYNNSLKTLLTILYRENTGGAEELLNRLKAFEV